MKTTHALLSTLFFSLSFTLLMPACTPIDEPKSQSTAIWPISVGNQWISLDSTYNRYAWEVKKDTLTINGKISINGVDGYYQTSTNSCIGNDSEGNLLCVGGVFGQNSQLIQSVIIKNYPTKGEKWISRSIYYNSTQGFLTDTVSFTCLGVDVPLQTPFGLLKCNVYSHTYYAGANKEHTNQFIDYYARGIGKVRTLHYEDGTLFRRYMLIKYTLR